MNLLYAILPKANHYVGIALRGSERKQVSVVNIEALIAFATKANAAGYDVFFAPAGYTQGWHDDLDGTIAASGKVRRVVRKAYNVQAVQSCWLDFDCGADGQYKTQRIAAQECIKFCSVIGIPYPVLVASGGGIHAYWIFDIPLDRARWEKLTSMLDAIVKHTKLLVDPSRTMDVASVMRVPGSFNYKHNMQRPCKVIYQPGAAVSVNNFATALINYANKNNVKPTGRSATRSARDTALGLSKSIRENTQLMKNLGHVLVTVPDKSPQRVYHNCKQIVNAGLLSEPVWFSMMTVMKVCEHGEVVAREISKRDSKRYDPIQFKQKWDYVNSLPGGPATCATFESNNPSGCVGCAFRGRITSPAELGRKPNTVLEQSASTSGSNLCASLPVTIQPNGKTETPEESKFLYAYQGDDFTQIDKTRPTYDARGHGLYMTVDPEAPQKFVAPWVTYFLHVQNIRRELGQWDTVYMMEVAYSDGETRNVALYPTDLKSEQSFMQWTARNRLVLYQVNTKRYHTFMQTYLAQYQRKVPQVPVQNQFGWINIEDPAGNKQPGFVLGRELLTPHTTPSEVGLRPAVAKYADDYLTQLGDIQTWKKVPDFYKRHNILWGQLGICMGFGAALMKFAPGNACNGVINFWSEKSGTGKTTLQTAINSIWGVPERQLLDMESTNNSRFMVMGWRNNLPVCINETTNMQDRELSSFLFQSSEGREKSRMNDTNGLQISGSWNTLIIMSANNTIVDKMTMFAAGRDGEVKRAIDIETSMSGVNRSEATQLVDTMNTNYGGAGRVFIQKILDTPGLFGTISESLRTWVHKRSVSQDERFWENMIATAIVGGELAKSFGLIDFDMNAVEDYARDTLNSMRDVSVTRKQTNKENLSDFLNESFDATLVVASAKRSGKLNPDIDVKDDLYIKRYPNREVAIRVELAEKLIYIRTSTFRDWCKSHMLVAGVILDELYNEGVVIERSISKRLGAGVPTIQTDSSKCFVVKATGE